jgi:hypothetical protein
MVYYEFVGRVLTILAACSMKQRPDTSSHRNYHNWTSYSKKSAHGDAVTAGSLLLLIVIYIKN